MDIVQRTVKKKTKLDYKDRKKVAFSRRVTKRYGYKSDFVEQVSSVIDIYKLNFVNNFEYILRYTKLTTKAYNSIMKSMFVRGTNAYIHGICTGNVLGFDLFFAAAFASFFKLPVSLVIGVNIKEKGIRLEDYGIERDMYIRKAYRRSTKRQVLKETPIVALAKKNMIEAAKRRAKSPARLLNVFDSVKRTIGERVTIPKEYIGGSF